MSKPFHVQQILFPTDFSAASEAAAVYVAPFAEKIKAKVCLLHVVAWMPGWQGASETYYDNLEVTAFSRLREEHAAAEQASCRELSRFKDRYFGKVETAGCVKSGGVAECIIEQANDIHADLVMMPTRGLGPIRRFLIGSTAANVLHDLQQPLWTTPHARELETFAPWKHIVCAVDYRHLAAEVIDRANAVADIFEAA